MLLRTKGDAIILTLVLFKPMPAILRSAATLIFCGNSLIALRAVPQYKTVSFCIALRSSFLCLRYATPAKDWGLLRVVNTTAAAVGTSSEEGIGTRNVRERLGVQFGARATFVSRAAEGGVWCAEIHLPELRDAGGPVS